MITELDELKSAWSALDRRLIRQHAISFAQLRDQRLARTRRGLRPLVLGQIVLMAFGVVMLLLGVATWTNHRGGGGLLVAGVLLHLFGVITIIAGGSTLGLVARIDYAAPVLHIQRQLLRLRRWYIASGAVVGLPWWLLWIAFIMCLGQVDLWASAPGFVLINGAIGVVGLLATWWLHRWLHRPGREAMAQRLDDGAAGRSIVRAQAELDDLARFEQE